MAPMANLVKSPEKPVWVRRPMQIAEGNKDCVVECRCQVGPQVGEQDIIKLKFVTIRPVQWSGKVLGVENPVVAKMNIGQCGACGTTYWCPVGSWTEFAFLRWTVQNQQAAAGPKILVPGHRGLVK